MARAVLVQRRMEPTRTRVIEPWTVPFHVVMWTTLLAGFIMVMVVVLMR